MYKRGDIVLLPFPFTDLSAPRTRPAVVVSVEGFEQETGDFTVTMVTSVPRTTSYDYALKDWRAAHLLGVPVDLEQGLFRKMINYPAQCRTRKQTQCMFH